MTERGIEQVLNRVVRQPDSTHIQERISRQRQSEDGLLDEGCRIDPSELRGNTDSVAVIDSPQFAAFGVKGQILRTADAGIMGYEGARENGRPVGGPLGDVAEGVANIEEGAVEGGAGTSARNA